MTTIVSIAIIIALAALYLWECRKRVKLERQAAEDAVTVFNEVKMRKLEIGKLNKMVKLRDEQIKTLKKTLSETEDKYVDLDEKYSRHNQPRNSEGKFVKADGTYTPYPQNELSEAIELPDGVKMEEVKVTVAWKDGTDIENELSHE